MPLQKDSVHLPPVRAVAPPLGWETWHREILERLLSRFGPRGWWPAADDTGKAAPFEMIVGAILVQNIAWANTERALLALREAGLLDPASLLAAPAGWVEALIRPTGYFRQKTLKLKAFLTHLFTLYGGDLDALLARPEAELRVELLGIRGIGPETCDCILNYAAGYPAMAMDTYTRRIFSRLGTFAPEISYTAMQAFFHTHLPAETDLLGEYHAQIDTLGSRICLKTRPLCQQCPLSDICPRAGIEVNP